MAKKKSVDIVVPIYNEEEELAQNIVKLYQFLSKNITDYVWRVVIADNASTDNSLEIAKKLARKYSKIAFVHLNLKGRGRAVKKVWQEGKSDICVYMDVDLSTDLNSLSNLLKSFDKGYNIAIGSRLLSESKVIGRPIKREILSRVYNILIKSAFWTRFSDAQCGFKAVSRKVVKELIPKITDNAWFFDSELLIMGEKLGYRIYEVPVKWVDNPGSTVRVLHTVKGDLLGLWRLFTTRPWKRK
jgi:glycosyltransferase involved in cell wall biosynthesis